MSSEGNKAVACYARFLEYPACRWTVYETYRLEVEVDNDIPMITVERAYTSTICNTPQVKLAISYSICV
ncbi:MAG: DUF3604 domain-containing protein [Gammaproteobacteria bacterium]